MKTLVVSFSFTGNNKALSQCVAKELGAEHINISESKPRKMGTIVFDILLNRTPKVQPVPDTLEKYDLVVLFGPIWMGKVASPLRSYLKYLKQAPCQYAFVSLHAGAEGANSKIQEELNKRVGKKPLAVVDLHISSLLPKSSNLREDISNYLLNDDDLNSFTSTVTKTINEVI